MPSSMRPYADCCCITVQVFILQTDLRQKHRHPSNVESCATYCPTSLSGQSRKYRRFHVMSALPHKADINFRDCDVRFVPIADITRCRRACTASPSELAVDQIGTRS